jgi:hypothetical protein
MFDKSLFINHFNTGDRGVSSRYQTINVDPRGVRWGYIAQENVYEEINTGRRLTPLMLENFILEQTDEALGNAGDYGTEAGHGKSEDGRRNLTERRVDPGETQDKGLVLDFENFGVPQDSNVTLYTQRASVSVNAANSAQALVTGAQFRNTSQLPTVGYVSIRPHSSGVKGMILHSSVDSAEGVTMGGYTTDASPGGVATDLHSYLCEGQTWANTNQGGSGCIMTVRTGVSGAFSAGTEIKYIWDTADDTPDAQNSIFVRYSTVDIDGIIGPVGATWPGTTLDPVAGTAYWGHNPEFYIQIGEVREMRKAVTEPLRDVSQT